MRISAPAGLGMLFCLGVAVTARAQDAQVPVFRSGIELLEVDVNVVDGDGHPVLDLRSPEFSVSVDGQSRKVVSSAFIRDDSSQSPETPGYKDDPYVASNTDRPRGRLVVVVLDQNNITAGRARDLIVSVRRFIEQLPAADRVALVAIPSPGPAVEFTANRARIYQALAGIRGTEDNNLERYDIGDYEAIAMFNRGDEMVIRRLIDRECATGDPSCVSDVELEATRIVQRIRTRANESFYALGTLLTNLKEADGTKTLVFLSQGLILDDVQGKTATLAQTAAEARVNLNVVLLDDTPGEASNARRSSTLREDRDLREEGLDTLAARSRGALFRVTSSPEIAFDRLTREMSGHYLLGVEPTPKDRDGKTHQIRVQVKRRGATVRARREFRYTARASDARTREDQVVGLLRSPATLTDLPMRLSAYVFQDPESFKEKLLVAAEIDPTSSAGSADLMLAYVLFNGQGRAVADGRERKIFTLRGGQSIEYNWAMTAEPGTYTLRFAAIDDNGHRGSLEHDVRVWQLSGAAVAVGDLMLGRLQSGAVSALSPVVNARIDNGQLAAYTEFYSNRPEALDGVTVVVEVADNETAPALLRAQAAIAPRVEGAGRQASAVIPVGVLPPGRYFARAIVSASGQVVGRMARPFTVEPPAGK